MSITSGDTLPGTDVKHNTSGINGWKHLKEGREVFTYKMDSETYTVAPLGGNTLIILFGIGMLLVFLLGALGGESYGTTKAKEYMERNCLCGYKDDGLNLNYVPLISDNQWRKLNETSFT